MTKRVKTIIELKKAINSKQKIVITGELAEKVAKLSYITKVSKIVIPILTTAVAVGGRFIYEIF